MSDGDMMKAFANFFKTDRPRSYALNIIVKHVEKHRLGTYREHSAMKLFTETGIRLNLVDNYSLSIQTHPDVASEAFAETALVKDGKICYVEEYGYENVLRHQSPKELFEHIGVLVTKLKAAGRNNV